MIFIRIKNRKPLTFRPFFKCSYPFATDDNIFREFQVFEGEFQSVVEMRLNLFDASAVYDHFPVDAKEVMGIK